MSHNAGGLVRWPVYLCMPIGFVLLLLQVISEIIKRVSWLAGQRTEALSSEESLPPFRFGSRTGDADQR
jgi:TRAP-type mannitol/chloroaromatic compound transport system permease small subunit